MKYTAAVITVSDKGAKGERVDTSGPAICRMLADVEYEVIHTEIIPDEKEIIQNTLIRCADELGANLILTTGGTGFSPRDITPEATLAVIERETRGIPEAMRAESLRITPKGCLSRSVAGIRGRSLIINLPGSEKAVKENLGAVLGAVDHGIQMLLSEGSADCASVHKTEKKKRPSMDEWIRDAKKEPDAGKVGMYLFHNGVVRETARDQVRNGATDTKTVTGMLFSCDQERVSGVVKDTKSLEGIYHVRVWLNEGKLQAGEDIMYVLVGGDTRPHVMAALDYIVGKIKAECVTENELYE